MRRVRVVVLERDKRAVLREIGRMGAVQFIATGAGPETAPLAPLDRTKELGRWSSLRSRVEKLGRDLEIPAQAWPEAEPAHLTAAAAEQALGALETEAEELLKRREPLQQRQAELSGLCAQAASYRELDLPLGPVEPFAFLHFVLGSMPAENLAPLQQELGENIALLPLGKSEGRQALLAMSTRQSQPTLEKALQRAGFHPDELPATPGATPETMSADSQREQASITAELQQVNDRLRTLSAEAARPMAGMARLAAIEQRLLEAEHNFPRTEAAVLLTGWISASNVPVLEERLQEITRGRCPLETAAPKDLAEVPVVLHHSRLLRPFEMLVTAYGLPKYQELEPTLFVAVSFVLMFGFMFGDAGQGVVLALGGLLARLLGRSAKLRDIGLLVHLGGLSSIVFGVLYGSYFGLEQFKQYGIWHDPLAGNPLELMYGAIGVGVAMISLGLVLNVVNRFRCKDILGACLDSFGLAGMLFYWGMLTLITQFTALRARGLVSLALLLFLVIPVVGWTLKEPLSRALKRGAAPAQKREGSWLASIPEGLVGAFEAILSYLANTISFVRLAAYAMSHAALLVATFMMAAAVQHLPLAGNSLSVLVIVLGNLGAIVLEGVIASVQALRLEYYEFFGKFYSGLGQAFKPFRLEVNGSTAA